MSLGPRPDAATSEPVMLTAYVDQFKAHMRDRLVEVMQAELKAAADKAAEAAAADLRHGLRAHMERTHGMVQDVAVYLVHGSDKRKVP